MIHPILLSDTKSILLHSVLRLVKIINANQKFFEVFFILMNTFGKNIIATIQYNESETFTKFLEKKV